MYAKFQLSRLIFIFISFYSCYQLLTADDTCFEKKNKWNFHLLPKCDIYSKFELCRLLGGRAGECYAKLHRLCGLLHRLSGVGCTGYLVCCTGYMDMLHRLYGGKVKIVLNQALLCWCQGLSSAIILFIIFCIISFIITIILFSLIFFYYFYYYIYC